MCMRGGNSGFGTIQPQMNVSHSFTAVVAELRIITRQKKAAQVSVVSHVVVLSRPSVHVRTESLGGGTTQLLTNVRNSIIAVVEALETISRQNQAV